MFSEQIIMKNMQFYAFHGIRETEKIEGQLFQMDLVISANLEMAAEKDDLRETINYEAVYKLVDRIVKTNKFHLLEALANSIAKEIKQEYANVLEVEVTVRKPKVSINAIMDYVAIKVKR